jgi:hypothetical protein
MALESVVEADAEVRRLVVDVRIQAGIGHFFASKLRCGVLWAIFQQTREPSAAREAVKAYRQAREHWADAAKIGQVYVADLSYGEEPWLRGHWRDRLPQIEADIAEMARLADDTDGSVRGDRELVWAAIGQALAAPVRAEIPAQHQSPASFKPGSVVTLVISGLSTVQLSGHLHYRHVNQAEVWKSTDLVSTSDGLVATIPADYTQSRFALQYYFVLRKDAVATLYPGLAPDLANQPYFVIRQGV